MAQNFKISAFTTKLAIMAVCLAAFMGLAGPSFAQTKLAVQPDIPFETAAKQAILIDLSSNQILFEKNPDQRVAPASMTKLMTIYLLFERLKSGIMSLDDEVLVSEKAWRKGGSKMFIEVGKRVKIADLILGVIVQSGNDATIALAEAMAGSEEAFANFMTARAQALGLSNTQFKNASGWPEEGHYSTARDLALLSVALIRDFPEYYPYYSHTEFTYSGIRQPNRNLLLGVNGVDGLKTGHVEEAGYGIAVSAKRGQRRLVLVVHGLDSMAARKSSALRLLEYGFNNFSYAHYYDAGDIVARLPVWLGKERDIGLAISQKLAFSLPRILMDQLSFTVVGPNPIIAPIGQGDEVARLEVKVKDKVIGVWPLSATQTVEPVSGFSKLSVAFRHLLLGEAN